MRTFILVVLTLIFLCLTAPIWLVLITLGYLLENSGQPTAPITWPAVVPAGTVTRPVTLPSRPATPQPETLGGWRPYQWPPEGMILTLVGQEAEAAAAAGLPTEWLMPGGDRYYLRTADEPAPLPKLSNPAPRPLPEDGLPF